MMSMNPGPRVLEHLQAVYEHETRTTRRMKAVGIAVAGVVVGAAIMALLTPRTGRQVRRSVVSGAQRFVNPFGSLTEEVTRPELLARIAADERAELAAKVRALNEDDIDVDTGLPMHRERGIV